MKKLTVYIAGCLLAAGVAGHAVEPVAFPEAAANYQAYPEGSAIGRPTPAPEGYRAFHIEHYGRHGSRWLIGEGRYQYPVDVLEMAGRAGALTPRGAEALVELKTLRIKATGRDGELTQLGAEQHRGIARRMARNFPTVFAPGTCVDARSSTVIRCILSMLNEIEELVSIYDDLVVHTDASAADMYYIANPEATASWKRVEAVKDSLEAFRNKYPIRGDFAKVLISDDRLIADSVDIKRFNDDLFDIAANSVSHGAQSDIATVFSRDEIHEQWLRTNAFWFWRSGNWPVTGGKAATNHVALLHNIVESADTALMSPRQSVNLRFGHESVLMPLVVLLEIDDYAKEYRRLEDLVTDEGGWRNYEVFPMAANVQLIFYRPYGREYTEDDILVKAMLNEREVRLPATPVEGMYYRWSDLRERYLLKNSD